MGGRASRQKGMRGEYTVINYFRQRGMVATRVPLSGASQGEKGDIKLEIPGTRRGTRPMDAEFLWGEVKCRSSDFKAIYEFYDRLVYYKIDSLCFAGQLLTITTDFSQLGLIGDAPMRQFHENLGALIVSPKTMGKLVRMRELLKGCDFLVIKCDYKPLLFIRYYGEGTA